MSFFFSPFIFSATDRLAPLFYPTCLSRCRTRLIVKKHWSLSCTIQWLPGDRTMVQDHFHYGLFHLYRPSAWVRHTTHDAAGEAGHAGDRRRKGGGAAQLTLFQTIREGTMKVGSDLPVLVEQLLYIWAPKNWCFWTVLLEKTLESPLDCKEIQPVHPKGNQSWIFIGRTDAEAEAPILWPPDAKNWLIRKDPDAEKDWRQEEKGTTGWDGWMASPTWWKLFTQAPGVGDGQGSLGCCSPCGHKVLDTTE